MSQSIESRMEEGKAGVDSPSTCPSSPTVTSVSENEKGTRINSLSTQATAVEKAGTSVPTTVVASKPVWSSKVLSTFRGRLARFHRRPAKPIKVSTLNEHPRGYPNLAAFLDSHENFMIYRRFGYLQSRMLLSKQDELRQLEAELKEMDTKRAAGGVKKSRTRRWDTKEHKELMKDLESTYCSYANLLQAAHSMMSFKKPSKTDYCSVSNYMNNRAPLVPAESEWIQRREDLVSLEPVRDNAWLDEILEGLLRIFHCKAIEKIFVSNETSLKTIDCKDWAGNEHDNYTPGCELYYTPTRVAKLSYSILLVFVLILLIIPIWLMYHIIRDIGSPNAYITCIGIMLVATLAFSSSLALFTSARRHELLAAAAAYCAVLVVFLGNVGDK